MSRLYDRAIIGSRIASAVKDEMRQSVVYVGDNVADFYFVHNPKEYWYENKDFPNQVPPFERMWFDFEAPSHIVSEKYGTSPWGNRPRAWAILMDYEDGLEWSLRASLLRQFSRSGINMLRAAAREARIAPDADLLDNLDLFDAKLTDEVFDALPRQDRLRTLGELCQSRDYNPDYHPISMRQIREDIRAFVLPRWTVHATLFMQHEPGLVLPEWTWNYGVHVDGVIGGRGVISPVNGEESWCVNGPVKEGRYALMSQAAHNDQAFLYSLHKDLISYLHPALLTISFIHCRNVRQTQVEWPERLQKSRVRKKRGEPLVSYRVVNLMRDKAPVRQGLDRVENAATGRSVALHLVPGHIKHYGGSSGNGLLFGKWEGNWFWPSHVRGSIEEGVSVKDYKLARPRAQEAV